MVNRKSLNFLDLPGNSGSIAGPKSGEEASTKDHTKETEAMGAHRGDITMLKAE